MFTAIIHSKIKKEGMKSTHHDKIKNIFDACHPISSCAQSVVLELMRCRREGILNFQVKKFKPDDSLNLIL